MALASTAARIGYCTNVHAGTDVATIRERLQEVAAAIAAERLRQDATAGPLPVGLWIPAAAAAELSRGDAAADFASWLRDRHLHPLTLNGFPYDNFHLPVVKHRVYRPAWWEPSRLDYTVQLANLLHRLLPEDGSVGSISTLPLGWPGPLGSGPLGQTLAERGETESGETASGDSGVDWSERDRANVARAGAALRSLAQQLQRLEQASGRRIVVAIEPEPGCLLDRCGDVVDFFEKQLPEANHRRYLTVCHDVCHSAVMFESQADALAAYAQAGITLGKVQISSAIDVPLAQYSPAHRRAAIAELAAFAEDRYLHQTGVRDAAGNFRLVEDLPQWLASPEVQRLMSTEADQPLDDRPLDDQHLRIHFHVPIFRRALGTLLSTQQAIAECVRALGSAGAPPFTGHYEIETYAWSVLPQPFVAASPAETGASPAEPVPVGAVPASAPPLTGLAAGIAQELQWFETLFHASQLSGPQGSK